VAELTGTQSRLIDEVAAASAGPASLSDIQHVVILMQENRSFDHYFGTLSGVRGFSDPNRPRRPVRSARPCRNAPDPGMKALRDRASHGACVPLPPPIGACVPQPPNVCACQLGRVCHEPRVSGHVCPKPQTPTP
jgi:Phosphoesterase family